MKVVSVEQMRGCDAYTIEHFVPSMELIRRAAYSVFREVEWRGNVGIAVGSGNNGADGFALACILKEHHIDAAVYTVGSRLHTECKLWAEQAESLGIRILPYEKGCFREYDILVDCMLGTGFSGSLKESFRDAIAEVNASDAYVASVDINSGMNGNTGAGDTIVSSDLTVTVEFVKKGQLTAAAGEHMKRLVCVQIGIVDAYGAEYIPEKLQVSWLDRQPRRYV